MRERQPAERDDPAGEAAHQEVLGHLVDVDSRVSVTSSFPVTNYSRMTATTIISRSALTALTALTAGNWAQSDHRPTNPAAWDAQPDSRISVAAAITSNGMSPRCYRPASRVQTTIAVGTIMTGTGCGV